MVVLALLVGSVAGCGSKAASTPATQKAPRAATSTGISARSSAGSSNNLMVTAGTAAARAVQILTREGGCSARAYEDAARVRGISARERAQLLATAREIRRAQANGNATDCASVSDTFTAP